MPPRLSLRTHPVIRQLDEMDCGPAALASIAAYHGRPVRLPEVRELAGTDRGGSTLLDLQHAAEQLGFRARGVKGSYDALLQQLPVPAIAHVKMDDLLHYVVLYQVTREGVVLGDPARGLQSLTREQFCEKWTGRLLLVAPDAVKGVSSQSGIWRLLGLLRVHAHLLAEVFLCGIFLTVIGLTFSLFVRHLVDSVLVRHETSLLNALGVGMALVLTFRILFTLLEQFLLAHISKQVDLALISRYTRHLLGLPVQFFQTRRVGEILSRVGDAEKIREAISGTTLTVLVDAVLVVVLLSVLWMHDWALAAITTGFVPLFVLAVVVFHPATSRRSTEERERAGQLSAHLNEDVSGVEAIKAFGLERLRAAEGESRLVRQIESVFALQKIALSMNGLITLLGGAVGLTILWYGGHRVIAGAMTLGQLLFFHSVLSFLLGPLERLASLNVKLQEARVAVERLYQVLDVEPEQLGGNKVKCQGLRNELKIENVSFGYGRRQAVLRDATLTVPAGKTVAIVGESGSGKSTLLRLLLGFHAPTGGRILLDGLDLRDVTLASLRGRVGLVAQDPFIFTGTVRDNIALGAEGVAPEDVIIAARLAGLEEFINALPDRYDTVIGERGTNLSGGQRQRLAIARVLVRRPDILLFDEATSHLDTATEQEVQQNLKSALAGKTVVLVAHRLSTVKDADLIYVLHQGQVVECGGHQALLERGGRYAALWFAQSGVAQPQ